MQIALGLGLGLSPPAFDVVPAPLSPPTLTLSLMPPVPAPGDLVTLTGVVGGNPLPVGFGSVVVTIAGTAVSLTGTGLTRRFVARGGALAAAATVSTAQGTGSATVNEVIPPGVWVESVVGFGSSTMEGDGATATATRALNLIGGTLGVATIRNQGVAGSVLQNSPDASGNPRVNNGRDRFAMAMLGANKSARACLLYGANDLRYTAAPATFNVVQFKADLQEVMTGLLTDGYMRDEIVIGSPNWYPDATYAVGSAGFTGSNRTIHEAHVAACADVAAEFGVAYADVYGKMRDLGGVDLMSEDGLHCNDAGHQVIAHAFLTAAILNVRSVPAPGVAISPALSSLSLTWGAVPGAVSYRVEVGRAGSHTFDYGATVTELTCLFEELPAGPYLGRVRVNFADGAGPWGFWTGPVMVSDTDAPGGAITGQDTFAGEVPGTLIADLSADLGVWARHAQSTGQAAITSDGTALRGPGSTSQFLVATIDDEPIAMGVFVEMDFRIRSNSSQLVSYAVARASAASLTYLAAGYNGSAWRILKYVNGAATVLGSYALTEAIGATPVMRFEVEVGLQRLYRNDVLVLTTTAADADLGALGEGLGLRLGAGSTAWSSTNGGQITAIRVGRLAG
ncbi:MAG: GDSL-type esterase/lipase family protein [Paracoccaceae bacterium]